MTMASLMISAQTELRSALSLPEETKTIRIRADGSPLHSTGQTFIAIHKGPNTTDGNRQAGTKVGRYDFQVTVSIRYPGKGAVSPDRDDVSIIGDSPKGILALVETCKTALSGVPGGYAVIAGATTSNWVEPPICTDDGGSPSEQWPGWLSQTLSFTGALRDEPGTGVT